GKKVVNGEDVRRGLETLDITAERWKELGLEGFTSPIKLSCADHNGAKNLFLLEWDGTKFVKATDAMPPLRKQVQPLIDSAAKEYSTANTGWPSRSETCDRAS
ncbi:MAG TPA: ABC transporter permease, partial [Salinarimonas sp.]|nr:ABC transporter permease [Salinarimonas sp.]